MNKSPLFDGYKNLLIYRNHRIATILGKVSFTLSTIEALLLISFFIFYPEIYSLPTISNGVGILVFLFYMGLLIPSLSLSKFSNEGSRPIRRLNYAKNDIPYTDNPAHADIRHISFVQFWCVIPIISAFSVWIINMIVDLYHMEFAVLWVNCCGAIAVPHIPAYIGCIFLSLNKHLIKKEKVWLKEKDRIDSENEQLGSTILNEKKERKLRITESKQLQKAQSLLNECGIKFFIKYYKQISILLMRDVEIQENYSLEEKEIRYRAAKSIIDQGLTRIAAKIILTKDSILTSEEIELTKEILNDSQNKSSNVC